MLFVWIHKCFEFKIKKTNLPFIKFRNETNIIFLLPYTHLLNEKAIEPTKAPNTIYTIIPFYSISLRSWASWYLGVKLSKERNKKIEVRCCVISFIFFLLTEIFEILCAIWTYVCESLMKFHRYCRRLRLLNFWSEYLVNELSNIDESHSSRSNIIHHNSLILITICFVTKVLYWLMVKKNYPNILP